MQFRDAEANEDLLAELEFEDSEGEKSRLLVGSLPQEPIEIGHSTEESEGKESEGEESGGEESEGQESEGDEENNRGEENLAREEEEEEEDDLFSESSEDEPEPVIRRSGRARQLTRKVESQIQTKHRGDNGSKGKGRGQKGRDRPGRSRTLGTRLCAWFLN